MLTGGPGDPPTKSGLSLVDYSAGLAAAFGIASAIFDAHRSGRGRDVDVSLYDVGLSLLSYPATWFLSAGVSPERQALSAHPSIVPFQFFETSDGYIAIACAKEPFFRRLVEALELGEVAADPRFSRFSDRFENRDELLSVFRETLLGRSTDTWIQQLHGLVPCAPVRSMEDALDVDDLRNRGLLMEYDHQELGLVRMLGSAVRFGEFVPSARSAPRLDGDRDVVLDELGPIDAEASGADE